MVPLRLAGLAAAAQVPEDERARLPQRRDQLRRGSLRQKPGRGSSRRHRRRTRARAERSDLNSCCRTARRRTSLPSAALRRRTRRRRWELRACGFAERLKWLQRWAWPVRHEGRGEDSKMKRSASLPRPGPSARSAPGCAGSRLVQTVPLTPTSAPRPSTNQPVEGCSWIPASSLNKVDGASLQPRGRSGYHRRALLPAGTGFTPRSSARARLLLKRDRRRPPRQRAPRR